MIARDVAPGQSWAFREHRTVAEVDRAALPARLARLDAARAMARARIAGDETTLLAYDWASRVRNDAGLGEWVAAALGVRARADAALWRRLGIGVGRATLHRDGTWEPFADGDVPREVAGRGVPVLIIPVVPGGCDIFDEGFEAIEIYAVELAPGVPRRATGRVYALTGLALGLGLDTSVFQEWRGWSKGLAVVASPLDWVRAHRVWSSDGMRTDKEAAEAMAALLKDRPHDLTHLDPATHPEPSGPSGIVAPFLGDPAGDGMPCVWLADIVPGDDAGKGGGRDFAAGDPDPDKWRAREIDRLLLESEPIVADSEATALAIKARVTQARKRAFPANPTIQIEVGQIDVTEDAKGEAA